MKISEVFYSIQGEGALTGVPSAFIRTSGCNLRCDWCDTKYASWDPEGEDIDVEAIMQKVASMPTRYCVLTGGEPTIAPGIQALVTRLRQEDMHVTVETNATVFPEALEVSLASMSPKLSNSEPDAEVFEREATMQSQSRRWKPAVIDAWIRHCDYQLKFVVATEKDLKEIDELLSLLREPVPPEKIMLMPEGTEKGVLESRRDMLVEACKRMGYRYCTRLHIDLFGNTRGT